MILRGLPKLLTLTLHGNPIENIPDYHSYVVSMLPQLENLDFSPVLKSERQASVRSDLFGHTNDKKKKSM